MKELKEMIAVALSFVFFVLVGVSTVALAFRLSEFIINF